ncbi:MAG: chorismate mutase [Polyangiaceae bacterium]|nr:chorismate mutase [Polyangiaceae bacterium]MCE7894397.1 chorismate mutase [Sorangiineae bacterium PRO1]MCL4751225.1 chorismate mutase [Myxococcales bacterium]
MDAEPTLSELRDQIDRIDDRLLELLAERVRVALRIGELKNEGGLPVYDPERERSIYLRLCQRAMAPLTPDVVRRVFERIVDETRWAEQRAKR